MFLMLPANHKSMRTAPKFYGKLIARDFARYIHRNADYKFQFKDKLHMSYIYDDQEHQGAYDDDMSNILWINSPEDLKIEDMLDKGKTIIIKKGTETVDLTEQEQKDIQTNKKKIYIASEQGFENFLEKERFKEAIQEDLRVRGKKLEDDDSLQASDERTVRSFKEHNDQISVKKEQDKKVADSGPKDTPKKK